MRKEVLVLMDLPISEHKKEHQDDLKSKESFVNRVKKYIVKSISFTKQHKPKKLTREELIRQLLERQKSLRERGLEGAFQYDGCMFREFSQWKQGFESWISHVKNNEDALNAIREYTSDAPGLGKICYSELNNYLRTDILPKNDKSYKEKIDDLDSRLKLALSYASLPRSTIVYRKVSDEILKLYTQKDISTLQKDDILTEKGYMSTTLSRSKCENIAVYGTNILRIIAPKDTKAAFIDDITATSGELEVLFSRGHRLKIVDIRDASPASSFRIIDCSIVNLNSQFHRYHIS